MFESLVLKKPSQVSTPAVIFGVFGLLGMVISVYFMATEPKPLIEEQQLTLVGEKAPMVTATDQMSPLASSNVHFSVSDWAPLNLHQSLLRHKPKQMFCEASRSSSGLHWAR